MIPIPGNNSGKNAATVTWTLVFLNVVVFLWDRQGRVLGPSVVFADLGMRPQEVVLAIKGSGDRFALVTLFTSMFLHGSLWHLLGNLIYFLAFGGQIERALGAWRYALYYLFWGIMALAAETFVAPHSSIPVVGASGAISGVLGAYLLLFPATKIELFIPFLFVPIVVSAWMLLGVWFLWQVFIPQPGVANWAHVGGFVAGMATVLVMGGRAKVLAGRRFDEDGDYEE